MDRKKQVLVSLRQGIDIRTISQDLDLGEDYVRQIAQDEMKYLSLATLEIQEHFVAMTFARAEKIMSRIFPIFDQEPPTPESLPDLNAEKQEQVINRYHRMIGEGVKNYVTLTRLMKDVLQVKGVGEKDKPSGDTNIAINNLTISAAGDLYQEALDAIHTDYMGETFPEMQARLLIEGDIIQLPSEDRLTKIEKAVEHLHDTANSDSDPS